MPTHEVPAESREIDPGAGHAEIRASSSDSGFDLCSRTDDAAVVEQAFHVGFLKSGDSLGVKVLERAPERRSSAKDERPGQSRLEPVEHELFPESAAVVLRDAPFFVVIRAEQRVGFCPITAANSSRSGRVQSDPTEAPCRLREAPPHKTTCNSDRPIPICGRERRGCRGPLNRVRRSPVEITEELPGSRRPSLEGYRRVGPADPKELADVTIYLRRRQAPTSITALPSFGPALPPNRNYVDRKELGETYGSDAEDVAAVRSAAATAGLQVSEVDLYRRSLHLRGTVAALTRVFGVDLGQYEGPVGSFRARTGTLRLPPELKDRVIGVFGLDQRPQVRTHFRSSSASEISYSPAQIATAYAFPEGANGTGQTIALLEFGGGFRTEDLASFFSPIGQPTPNVTTVSVDGASNASTGAANGPDAEVELDIELAGAWAPAAQIVVYFAPNSDQGFLDALSTAVHDATNHPNVVSISWGGPEETWTEQAMSMFNQICEDATAMGVTITAASGDGGASDGEPTGTLAVDFPSSSPYVLGCGGTRLELDVEDVDEIRSEVVWNDLSDDEGATGGGVSQVFPLPSYQATAGVPTGEGGFVGRGVPDVAGDADPQTGYSVFVDGAPTSLGGTSAVAPLWAALIVRLNQSLGAALGFLQPLLYAVPEATTFHPITEGGNGGFDAGPGWNACTGLGSPNGTALLGALAKE
jgi:kumamolisin